MRTKIIVTALLSAALAAAPAAAARTAAANQAGQEATSQASGAAAKERKVCKRLENSGTRLRADRVCLTSAEWRKLEAAE
jgi:Ni/Co efflux regulator RcnB